MGKRGPKPKGIVPIIWSADFAYAIGLIASDGSLSKDGRHISFVSADRDLVEMFHRILGLRVKIGMKLCQKGNPKRTPHVQFGDVLFYRFLESIGLTPNKSLTIKNVKVPKEFFIDFLRGNFDGDGSSYSYWDKRWKSSFMFYTEFCSGSREYIEWLRENIFLHIGIKGHIASSKTSSYYQLKYAKKESVKLIDAMYYGGVKSYLLRKRLKIEATLCIMGKPLPARVEKLADSLP